MSNTKLTEAAKQMLTGRRIIECGNDYIKLDNGHHIYLTDEEIESLNPYEDETENN
jgi:hypothetical protein